MHRSQIILLTIRRVALTLTLIVALVWTLTQTLTQTQTQTVIVAFVAVAVAVVVGVAVLPTHLQRFRHWFGSDRYRSLASAGSVAGQIDNSSGQF